MPEIRVDPLTGYKTIVAGERSRRPGGEPRCVPPDPIDVEQDPFAEGHEDRTPPELYAVRPDGGRRRNSPGWTVRVVPNLYPALTAGRRSRTDHPRAETRGRGGTPADLFAATPASGAHEVIVNAPQSVYSLAELPVEQVVGGHGGVARADARPRGSAPACS